MRYPDTKIHQGDALTVLRGMESESVHCVVTSPPYYGLRDYGCEGQIGMEGSAEEWIAKLVEVFGEVRRVLRRDGTIWLNVGDSYACAPNGRKAADITGDDRRFRDKPIGTVGGIFKAKDQMLLPHRLAIALQASGWWVRSTIVWSKPNPMPESCLDRPTTAHEYVFLLSRSERYYYDSEAVREPAVEPDRQRYDRIGGRNGNSVRHSEGGMMEDSSSRNRRTVWEIPTEPVKEAHFACYPRALVRPCILAGTSAEGCCGACGAPFVRQVEKIDTGRMQKMNDGWDTGAGAHGTIHRNGRKKGESDIPVMASVTTGWAQSCDCVLFDPRPCVVLDPFAGSGTTGEVALSLGRSAVLIELSAEYVKLIEKRLSRAQVPLPLGV